MIIFVQTLGGALFVSVGKLIKPPFPQKFLKRILTRLTGQNVFTNKLITDLAKYAPSVDPKIVLSSKYLLLRKNESCCHPKFRHIKPLRNFRHWWVSNIATQHYLIYCTIRDMEKETSLAYWNVP